MKQRKWVLGFFRCNRTRMRCECPSQPKPHPELQARPSIGQSRSKPLKFSEDRKFSPKEHQDIHNSWLAAAGPFLAPWPIKEDYFMEYLTPYQLAKYPLGSAAVAKKHWLPPSKTRCHRRP